MCDVNPLDFLGASIIKSIQMKSKIFVFAALVLLILISLWQYALHYKLSQTDMACGGDWSYGVKCPFGSYCSSLGQGPLAGGICKPWLSSVFGIFEGQGKSTQTTTPVEEPSPEEWKTYTNKALGFSVRYPGAWSLPEERILSTRTEIEWDGLTITVGVVYNQSKERELSYLEVAERLSYGKEPDHISIDGHPAVYLKMRDEDLPSPKPNPYNLVVIQGEQIVYELYTMLPLEENFPKEYQEAQTCFDQVLSTFKFLD